MTGMIAEGELWWRGGSDCPQITVLLSRGHGNPRHEGQYLTTATERNCSLFVKIKKNSKLEEGPQGAPGARLV